MSETDQTDPESPTPKPASDGAEGATPNPEDAGSEPEASAAADAADAAADAADAAADAASDVAASVPLRSFALLGLLILAILYTCYLAAALLLPIVLAVLLSLILSPVVQGLSRLRVPPVVSALVLVAGLCAGFVGGVYLLASPVAEWVDKAPTTLSRVERKLRQFKEPVEKVQRAGEEVQKLTEVDAGARTTTVEVQEPNPAVSFMASTVEALVGAALVLVLLYFLLASGDLFLRKLIRVLPRVDARRAVAIARQLQSDLSQYLVTVTAINLALGAAVAVAMHFLDMPNPLLWGVMAAVLNFVPYLGAIVGMAVIGLVSVVTFDDVGQMLLPPLAYLLLTAAEGYFLTPTILGRRLTLNPVMILISLLLWSWLWGIPGAVLSVPMLASFKIFCDHIDRLKPIGEFLGR